MASEWSGCSIHALPTGPAASQGPEVCLLGGDIPSLPVTALQIYVRIALGYENDAFSFFSDKLLNFSLNPLIKIDA